MKSFVLSLFFVISIVSPARYPAEVVKRLVKTHAETANLERTPNVWKKIDLVKKSVE